MLEILTQKSVNRTMAALGHPLKSLLQKYYLDSTTEEDRFEFSYSNFCTDLVSEVAYRSQAGQDGNWDEFVSRWNLGPDTYNFVLRAMKSCGFEPTLTKW